MTVLKIWAVIRWILLAVVLQIFLIPLAYLIFPFSYLLRSPLRKLRASSKLGGWLTVWLWIFLDDEEFEKQGHDYGEPWWIEAKGLKLDSRWNRFKAAYLWGVIRNPAWNQYELIRPKQGDKELLYSRNRLLKNGSTPSPYEFAVLKWVDKDGNYSDNKGEYISKEHSIFGKVLTWYRIKGRVYFRSSLVKKIKNFWIELQVGTNDRRYTVRFKIKKGDLKCLD